MPNNIARIAVRCYFAGMTFRLTFGRFLIAVLLIAQLGGVVHAADHGPGTHDHDGVACILGTAHDDDTDSAPPPSGIALTRNDESVVPCLAVDGVRTAPGVLVPPATGPPQSS